MKSVNIKRIKILENTLKLSSNRPAFATVIYDPSIPNFDPKSLGIDADVILMLPDNGRNPLNQYDF